MRVTNRGAEIPEPVGHYVFGDIVTGRIFHIPVRQLHLGNQAGIEELALIQHDNPTTPLRTLGDAPGPTSGNPSGFCSLSN